MCEVQIHLIRLRLRMSSVPSQGSMSKSLWSESRRLLELLTLDIDKSVIDYIVYCTINTVDYALDRPCTSSFNGRPKFCFFKYGFFSEFVSKMVYRSRVKMPVLLAAIVYIERAKPHLKIRIERWACERVFMGAFVLAGKYLSDYKMKNVHWAGWSDVCLKRDVDRMEREFLNILDWDLTIREGDILAHHELITSSCRFGHRSYLPREHTRPLKRSRSITEFSDHSPHNSSSSSSSSSSEYSPSADSSSSAPIPSYFHYIGSKHCPGEQQPVEARKLAVASDLRPYGHEHILSLTYSVKRRRRAYFTTILF